MRKYWIFFPIWVVFLTFLLMHFRGGSRADTTHQKGKRPILEALSWANPFKENIENEAKAPPTPWPKLASEMADQFERTVAPYLNEVQLFEHPSRQPTTVSFLWPVDDAGQPADPHRLEIALRTSAQEWLPYQDDLVAFYYPNWEKMAVEVSQLFDSSSLISPSLCPGPDREFERCYLIKHNADVIACLFLDQYRNFDDRDRFPKEEVYHRYFFQHGGIKRNSLTADAELRRTQFICGQYRLSLVDWPHTSLSQSIYRRLAASLRLRQPPEKTEIWEEKILADYGLSGALGLLHHGDQLNQLTKLFPPVAGGTDSLTFLDPLLERDIFYTIKLLDGKFAGMPPDWREIRRDPPSRESLAWMLEKSEGHAGPVGSRGYDLGALSDEDANFIFERFLGLAPNASAYDWPILCRTMANLAEMQLQNEKVPPLILQRLLELDLPQCSAIHVLHTYLGPQSLSALKQRLSIVLDAAASRKKVPELYREVQLLLVYQGKNLATTPRILLSAIQHSDPQIQAIAFGFIRYLPKEALLKEANRGLTHPEVKVRRRCAEAIAGLSALDPPLRALLEKVVQNEADAATLTFLKSAIQNK